MSAEPGQLSSECMMPAEIEADTCLEAVEGILGVSILEPNNQDGNQHKRRCLPSRNCIRHAEDNTTQYVSAINSACSPTVVELSKLCCSIAAGASSLTHSHRHSSQRGPQSLPPQLPHGRYNLPGGCSSWLMPYSEVNQESVCMKQPDLTEDPEAHPRRHDMDNTCKTSGTSRTRRLSQLVLKSRKLLCNATNTVNREVNVPGM